MIFFFIFFSKNLQNLSFGTRRGGANMRSSDSKLAEPKIDYP